MPSVDCDHSKYGHICDVVLLLRLCLSLLNTKMLCNIAVCQES